jgi:hypothetical protein
MATIQFRVDKQGQVHIDVSGVHDASCADITRAFEEALGIKVDVQQKPEFFIELEGTKVYESGE